MRARIFRFQRQQVLAVVDGLATGDGVVRTARQHVCEGTLAGAVGPHDGVDFPGVDLQVNAVQDFKVASPRRRGRGRRASAGCRSLSHPVPFQDVHCGVEQTVENLGFEPGYWPDNQVLSFPVNSLLGRK